MRRLLAKIRKLLRDRTTRQMFTRIVSVTAAIVVFVTTYALVLPAITMEIEADCGIEAHQHDDSCYEYGLICGLEESDQHQHGDGCYGRTGNLICGKEVHVHSEACYHRNEAEVMTGEISEPDDGSLMTAVPSDAGGVSAQSADVFMEEGAEPEDGVLPEDAGDVLDENEPQYDAETGLEAEDQDEAGDAYAGEDGISEDYGTFEENGDESVDSAENFSDGTAEVVDGDIGADGNGGNIEAGNDLENAAGPAENGEYTESGEAAAIETGDPAESAEQSGIDSQAAPTDAEEFIPALDPVLFKEVLDDRTGIYYYHTPDGETVENSANITDWKKIRKDTELGGNDLLRVYLAYTIPAGSLNATNGTARYRLPGNLHLSDGQVNAINQMENGIAAQYADYTNLQILDPENYHKYLGAEAVDGTRTPDQSVDDYLQSLRSRGQAADGADTDGSEAGSANGSDGSDVQEFISATVQVENFYDTDGSSGEKGALLGQDLIFTFSPYTIEENRHAYDSTGQQTKIGREVHGWLTLDFNMQQVNWIERESTVRTADIIFAGEGTDSKGNRISEIHTELTLVTENSEDFSEDTDGGEEFAGDAEIGSTGDAADADENAEGNPEAGAADGGVKDNTEVLDDEKTDADGPASDEGDEKTDQNPEQKDDDSADDAGAGEDDRNYPAQSFEDSITVRKGSLSTDAANDSAAIADAVGHIQRKTELNVSVVAEEGTFPEGTTMVLTPVTGNDLDTVAEAVEGTVEGSTAGFHAVNISFLDADGKEIEPRKPIKVSMQSESIRQAVENPSTAPVVVHIEDNKTGNDSADGTSGSSKAADGAEGTSGHETNSNSNSETNDTSGSGLDISTVTATTVPGSAESDNLTFEADSFSVYAIVYTVDFHYEINGKIYQFSLSGGEKITLSDLIEVLSIIGDTNSGEKTVFESVDNFLNEVSNVEFSDEGLVKVTRIDGDWELESL